MIPNDPWTVSRLDEPLVPPRPQLSYADQLNSFLSNSASSLGLPGPHVGGIQSAPQQPNFFQRAVIAPVQNIAHSVEEPVRQVDIPANSQSFFRQEGATQDRLAPPVRPSGGGGLLDNLGSSLKDLGSSALHSTLAVANPVLGAAAKYVGEPAFATLTGETSAARKPILDDKGSVVGYYRDKPSLLDALHSIGNAVTHPLQEYGRGEPALQERLANPHVQSDTLGSAALQTGSNPLALAGGLEGFALNLGLAAGTNLLNKHAQDIPVYRDLSPDVQQALQLLAPVAGSFAGHAIAKSGLLSKAAEPLTTGALAGEQGSVSPEMGSLGLGKLVKAPAEDIGGAVGAPAETAPAPVAEPQAKTAEGLSSYFQSKGFTKADADEIARVAFEDPAGTSPGQPPADGAPPAPPSAGGPQPAEPLPTAQVGPLRLPDITPRPLTKTELAMNAIKQSIMGDSARLKDEIATPAMEARAQGKNVVAAQAARLGALADYLVKDVFTLDAKGRITDLPGTPTVQDLAARLPDFEPFMNDTQRAAIARLKAEVEPYNGLLKAVGVDIGSRPDVQEGGFYLPRGRADAEGADAPLKAGLGGARTGFRKGFEKSATFESMGQGIDKGYEYAPLAEAVASYVNDAGTRILDQHIANYFKNVRDPETGDLLGQTPHARLLEQNPGIAKRVEGLRKSLTSLKSTYGRLTDRQQAAIDEFLNSPAPDLETLRDNLDTRVGANAVGVQGPNFGKTPGELQTTIGQVRQEVRDLMPDWKKALDKSRQTPRDQAQIGFSQLQGTSFPDTVAHVANRWLESEQKLSGGGAGPMRVAKAVNNLMRGLSATGDASFMGIQGALGAARDPGGFGKAMEVALRATANPRALGRYIADFDAQQAAKGLPTSSDFIANGLHVGGADTEFAVGQKGQDILSRVGQTIGQKDIPGTKFNPFRGSNRMFGYFGDTMRIELAKTAYDNAKAHGYDMTDPTNVRAVSNAANRATGWSPNRFMGDTGELFNFAPRFFQSQLETVAKAATDGGIAGNEARNALLKLLGSATLLTVLGNQVSPTGLSPKEFLSPIDRNGDWNPNFMRIRYGGQDVSLLGPWDSLLKGMQLVAKGNVEGAHEIMQGEFTGGLDTIRHGLTGFERMKSAPLVGMAWDLLSGKTFNGQNARTPGAVLQNFLPISARTPLQGEGPLSTAFNFAGAKSSPMSPTEQLDVVSQAQYGKGFNDLLPTQQEQVKNDHPDLWQRALENKSSETQKYDALRKQFAGQQSAADNQLLTGQLSREEWKSQYDDRRNQLAGAALALYGDKPITNPRDAQERWTQIIQQNSDPATKAVNWDAVDAAIANLSPDDQKWIADKQGIGDTPLTQQYKQAVQERIDYNDIPIYRGYTAEQGRDIQQLYTTVRARSRSADDTQMLTALRSYLNSGNDVDPMVVKGVRQVILGTAVTLKARQQYAKTHPLMTAFYGGNGKGGQLAPNEVALLQGELGASATPTR